MGDVLIELYQHSLPGELLSLLAARVKELEKGQYEELFSHPLAKTLLGHDPSQSFVLESDSLHKWNDVLFERLGNLLSVRKAAPGQVEEDTSNPAYRQHFFFIIAVAALYAFIQSNVTGPPLPFSSSNLIFPSTVSHNAAATASLRKTLVNSLTIDGVAAYRLIPNVELFCLADCILTSPAVSKNVSIAQWLRLRVDFMHQKFLTETSPTLQTMIYNQHIPAIDELTPTYQSSTGISDLQAQWLLEKATIHTHHGLDKLSRQAINSAAKLRQFDFALTGLLGKRTKWQINETSQLVVLARSHDSNAMAAKEPVGASQLQSIKPENLDLNDDTLLESISFTEKAPPADGIVQENTLPESLSSLDPGNQPLLHSLDSIILLSLASSITNTSPADGLTREETLPYATRVLEGGSSNWQIYTQALLVRSRIEGYRSRTVERGLLQLQTLVDQVIAETTSTDESTDSTNGDSITTFLPRPKQSESAPVEERLAYIFQLNSPTRWDMEAELAARWVSLGGLRSALDIYERLQMWAEAALCYAGVEREDKAKRIVRRQLYHASSGPDEIADLDTENWEGAARKPPPADAPRLYCILGDIDHDVSMYEKAWEVSNERYGRAQRSLGRHYIAINDYVNAAAAYSKALKANQLNQTTWFALGCALLELQEFPRAAEAFSRTVQLDDTDAEAWSNLAAALLRLPADSNEAPQALPKPLLDDEEDEVDSPPAKRDVQQHKRDALAALRRAAALKHDSFRIWDNLLTVAASLAPPAYNDVVSAQRRVIHLRGKTDGEACVDVTILEYLMRHVVSSVNEDGSPAYEPGKPGLARMVADLVDKHVVPLITSSRRLWKVVSTLALWRGRPGSALEASEKAWRAATAQVGWESGPIGTDTTSPLWEEVVEATVELADAYENLGEREKTEGLAAGTGELVAKDWRFKARSAVRGVMSRAKDGWEGSEGWERLSTSLEGLKGR